MLQGFKQFILKGNVVDLAVGIVIGAAFSTVIAAFTKDLLTPLISALGGQPTFGSLFFSIGNSVFQYGDFLNALIAFLITAAVVYFLIVSPMNHFLERAELKTTTIDPNTTKCPYCLSEIAIKASRCPFCTSELSKNSNKKND